MVGSGADPVGTQPQSELVEKVGFKLASMVRGDN